MMIYSLQVYGVLVWVRLNKRLFNCNYTSVSYRGRLVVGTVVSCVTVSLGTSTDSHYGDLLVYIGIRNHFCLSAKIVVSVRYPSLEKDKIKKIYIYLER